MSKIEIIRHQRHLVSISKMNIAHWFEKYLFFIFYVFFGLTCLLARGNHAVEKKNKNIYWNENYLESRFLDYLFVLNGAIVKPWHFSFDNNI